MYGRTERSVLALRFTLRGFCGPTAPFAASDQPAALLPAALERINDGMHAVLRAHERDPHALVSLEWLRRTVCAALGARPVFRFGVWFEHLAS